MGWTNPEFALLSGCVVVHQNLDRWKKMRKLVQFVDGCRVYILDHELDWSFLGVVTKDEALELINTADELYIQAEDYR